MSGDKEKHARAGKAVAASVAAVVTEGDRENLTLLSKLASRLQRVGLTFPGVEVRWENLLVEVEAPKQVAGRLCAGPDAPKRPRAHRILDAGSGVLAPGRMVLVLGPPGAGRTTLLRALAGQLVPPPGDRAAPRSVRGAEGSRGVGRSGLRVYGSVQYNGMDIHGGQFEVARTATFVGQTENHLAEMTVDETLTFAARCQGADSIRRLYDVLTAREAEQGLKPEDPHLERLMALARGPHAEHVFVELVSRMLSIDHVMDTCVGDDMLKGISGGQKRRVTAGEMVVGLAKVMMLDEISNGLDAASTLAIMRALRNVCTYANATVVCTLLQPSPEVWDCFDDVLLVSQGRVAFFGPRPQLLPFFAGLGLAPLPGQTAADFAQEVAASAEDQIKYRVAVGQAAHGAGGQPPALPAWAGRKWVSPKMIRQVMDAGPLGAAQRAALSAPPYTHPLQDIVLHSKRYGLSRPAMFATVLGREALLFVRNKNFVVTGCMQVLVTAFLASTTFIRMDKRNANDANLFMSVLFFSLMSNFMGGFNFAPIYCARLPVFYKQRDHRFYTPTAFALSTVLMRMPEVVITSLLYIVMVYWSVNFTPSAGRFFLMWLHLVVAGFNSTTTFQLIASVMRNPVMTQGIGAVILMLNVIASGFPIAPGSIPPWWIWFHWYTPMSWSLRSMLITELTSPDWPLADPAAGPGSLTVGQAGLRTRGFQLEFRWVWAGVGYVIGISMLYMALQIAALTFLGPPRGPRRLQEAEDDDALHPPPPGQPTFSTGSPFLDRVSFQLTNMALARTSHSNRASMDLQHHNRRRSVDLHALTHTHTHSPVHALGHPLSLPTSPVHLGKHQPAQLLAPPHQPEDSGSSDSDVEAVGNGTSGSPGSPLTSLGGQASSGGATSGVQMEQQQQYTAASEMTAVHVRPGGTGVEGAPATAAAAGGLVEGGGGDAGSSGGGDLSFRPVVVAFKDVSYFVPHPSEPGKELQLLSKVSGVFRPGVLTSLMGASGAGKTTLMDVLAGRKTGGRAEGLQLVDGRPKRMATFARIMGYVEQLDVHNPYMTVEESLLFSASLRVEAAQLPSASAVAAFARRCMAVVELGPLADALVGVGAASGGLSTEARKRLTIAVELVANPAVVFMDEPTSGLDARAAGVVMRAVRNTVATGRTVVCTIHQPNREIMDGFDELLLLKPGGRTIFFGPLGARQSALVSYLGGCVAGVPRYEAHMNPANWMLEVTSPAAEQALGVDFAQVWSNSSNARAAQALIDEHTVGALERLQEGPAPVARDVETGGAAAPGEEPPSSGPAALSRYARPTLVQLRLVLGRALVSQLRNPAYNVMRLAITLGLGLALGSLYWGTGRDSNSVLGVLNIMGVMYTSLLFLSMVNVLMVKPVVAAQRSVFYRERDSGMYRPAVFAAAQGLSELPFLFLQSLLYFFVVYCMVQFRFEGAQMCWFWLYVWLDLMLFTYMGIGVMNIMPNIVAATAMISFSVMLWNLFCGFLIYAKDIPPWWIWAYYFNPITWIIYGCVATQLGDLRGTFIDTGDDVVSVPQYIQDTLSYSYEMRGWIVLILVGFIIFFRALAYLGITRFNFQKR